jgi:hypothetical protein
MDIEVEIKKILFEIGKTISIHKIDEENSVIEINYEKYTEDILRVFRDYLSE